MSLAEISGQIKEASLVFGFIFSLFFLPVFFVIVIENFFRWFVVLVILSLVWAWTY